MANLDWQLRRNLESSLQEFIKTESVGVTVFYKGADQAIDVRVGNAPQQDWTLPSISVFLDDRIAPRGFIGNNKRLKTYLMIFNVRALDDGMRSDLTEWLTDTINDGFTVYTYSTSGDPDNPNKTIFGKASVEFVTDTPLRNTQNSESNDKFRQNISCNITIAI